jgi:hypothetical protein
MSGTPRHLKDREPRYVMVIWGWDGEEVNIALGSLGCVEFKDIPEAEANGAIVLHREDADFCKPRTPQRVDPYLLRLMQQHPYRTDAQWHQGRRKDMPDDNGANTDDGE